MPEKKRPSAVWYLLSIPTAMAGTFIGVVVVLFGVGWVAVLGFDTPDHVGPVFMLGARAGAIIGAVVGAALVFYDRNPS